MTSYVVRRLGQCLLTVLFVTLVIFVIVRVIGDPTHLMLPPEATEADRETLRNAMGLNDPIALQYFRFLANILQGDMGMSYRFGRPALDIVLERLLPTLLLTAASLGFGVVVGIPLGIASAVRPGGIIDYIGKIVALFGQAAPPFFFGMIFVFFFSLTLGLLPTSGFGGFQYLIMPAVALGWYSAAGIMRLTRSSMLEVIQSEFVKMARIKGVPERAVIYRHAFLNASLPIMTYTSLQFGILMGGAVSVESVFAWPGMGLLVLESISSLDYAVVQAAVTVIAIMFTAVNLTVDLLYAYIDPRIRYD